MVLEATDCGCPDRIPPVRAHGRAGGSAGDPRRGTVRTIRDVVFAWHVSGAITRLACVEDVSGAGDSSIEGFVQAHARSLFGTAYVLCGDADVAQDLVQDTLVALVPKWDRVDHAQQPLAYVRRALVHRHIDARRRSRGPLTRLEDTPEPAAPGDEATQVGDRDTVRRLLGRLSKRQRAAIVLKYLYDWPEDAIAAAIGCRPATVRSLTRRGLLALRGAVGRQPDPPPTGRAMNAKSTAAHAQEPRHD